MVNTATVSLGERLTIADVHDRQKDWQDLLDGEKDVVVNAADAASIDTAGLQLLLVLKRSLASRSRNLAWGDVNEEVYRVAARIDLQKDLGLTK